MPSSPYRLAWLFDVDGTLLTTDGAARQSFSDAVRERLGVEDDLADIAFAGRTEPLILADVLRKHGVEFEDGDEARFWHSVFEHMRRNLHEGRGWLMPGVPEVLDAVEREATWVPGLLTGNMTEMARIKLNRFGIASRFRFGGFGEQAEDRDRLAVRTVRHVTERFGVEPGRCIVVGDTPLDVACARAAGARVVTVATGWTPRAELAALEPDLDLPDLTRPERLLEWARGIAAESE